MHTREYIRIAKRKTKHSPCKFKVVAIGLETKGRVMGIVTNSPRFSRKGGGLHAEMRLIARYGQNIGTIILFRIGKGGSLLPIHPCKVCKKNAEKLGIKIISYDQN